MLGRWFQFDDEELLFLRKRLLAGGEPTDEQERKWMRVMLREMEQWLKDGSVYSEYQGEKPLLDGQPVEDYDEIGRPRTIRGTVEEIAKDFERYVIRAQLGDTIVILEDGEPCAEIRGVT